MGNLAALVPVALFLAFAVGLSVVVRHRTQSASDDGGFVKEYFIGNRGLGGLLVAMTTIATWAVRARRGASASAGCTWPWCR